MLDFECPKCGELMEINTRMAGRQVRCVQCDKLVRVPEPEAGEEIQRIKAPALSPSSVTFPFGCPTIPSCRGRGSVTVFGSPPFKYACAKCKETCKIDKCDEDHGGGYWWETTHRDGSKSLYQLRKCCVCDHELGLYLRYTDEGEAGGCVNCERKRGRT